MVSRAPRRLTVFLISSALVLSTAAPLAAEVLLGDIVGGGDGHGTAPDDLVGISADDGTFQMAMLDRHIVNTGPNPQKVRDTVLADGTTGSRYIDSVFLVSSSSFPINSDGATFDFPAGDPQGQTWNHILKNKSHDYAAPLTCGGRTYSSGVGLHSSAGITFDLLALRGEAADPEDVGFFSAVVGMDSCGGHLNAYVILSDELSVFPDFFSGEFQGGEGRLVQMLIPPEARYLTLATGNAGDGDGCDHGVFADARLMRNPRVVVTRSIPQSLLNGTSGTITLTASPRFDTGSVMVHELLPPGLIATRASDGGSVAGDTVTWNLGLVTGDVVLTYEATADSLAEDGAFAGTAVVDGHSFAIAGDTEYTGAPVTSLGFIKLWNHLGPFAFARPPAANDHGPPGSCDSMAPDEADPTLLVAQLLRDWIRNDGGTVTEANTSPFPGLVVRPKYGGDGLPGGTGARAAGLVVEAGDTGAVVVDRFPAWHAGFTHGDTIDHASPEVNGIDAEDHVTLSSVYVTNHTGGPIATQMGYASDDSIQILLNAEDITQGGMLVCRGYGAPNTVEDLAPVTLPDGESRILVKVSDGSGASGFRLRFEDPADPAGPGLGLPDITLSTESALSPRPGRVRRLFSRPSYGLGEKVRVSLEVSLAAPSSVKVVELLPPLSVVSNPSGGGVLSPGAIAWDLDGVDQATLTYDIEGERCSGDLAFSGSTFTVGPYEVLVEGDAVLARSDRRDDLGPWTSVDIGGATGSGAERLGDHAVLAAGRGDGAKLTRDSLHFIATPQSGDFELSARIDCMEDPAQRGLAGLMVRNTTEEGSVNVYLGLTTLPPGGGGGVGTLKASFRAVAGKSTAPVLFDPASPYVSSLPIHLKLRRAGSTLYFQRSETGADWTDLATKTIGTAPGSIQLADDVLIGLGVTSGGSGIARADLSQVSGPPFLAAGPTFRRGDVDGNGVVEITDPVNFLGYVFLGIGVGGVACFEAADTDNNGVLDITDAVNSLGYQFLGAAPPAPPGPAVCGPDPNAPFLGCAKGCGG